MIILKIAAILLANYALGAFCVAGIGAHCLGASNGNIPLMPAGCILSFASVVSPSNWATYYNVAAVSSKSTTVFGIIYVIIMILSLKFLSRPTARLLGVQFDSLDETNHTDRD